MIYMVADISCLFDILYLFKMLSLMLISCFIDEWDLGKLMQIDISINPYLNRILETMGFLSIIYLKNELELAGENECPDG